MSPRIHYGKKKLLRQECSGGINEIKVIRKKLFAPEKLSEKE
jgi:hypothetical protein